MNDKNYVITPIEIRYYTIISITATLLYLGYQVASLIIMTVFLDSTFLNTLYFSPFFLQLLLATKYFVVLVRIGALFMMRGSPDKRKPNQQAGGQAIYHKRGFMVFVVLVFFFSFLQFL